ncbi:MAG: hypothetical protein IPN72_08795 [Saprospiraceae bacterium]|nr:hypothetical protein [Saprospiraceae bacterium]
MKVADTGLLVVNSAHGVGGWNRNFWEYTRTFATPTMVINQCDHEQSNFNKTLTKPRKIWTNVNAFSIPTEEGLAFNAIIDALRLVMYKFPEDGGKSENYQFRKVNMPKPWKCII